MKTQKILQIEDVLKVQEVETCERCGNIYKLIWLKEGHDYNDFGLRYCPFCGLLTDEFYLPAGD